MPLVQNRDLIRVLKPGNLGNQVKRSYAAVLDFEDNQFKKQKVDKHDQVISMMHATKEAMLIEDDNQVNDREDSPNEVNKEREDSVVSETDHRSDDLTNMMQLEKKTFKVID